SNRLFRNWSLFKCRCGRVRLNLCGISCFLCLLMLVDLVTNIFCVKIFGNFIKDRGIFFWINRLLWSSTAFLDSILWFFLLLPYFLWLLNWEYGICFRIFFLDWRCFFRCGFNSVRLLGSRLCGSIFLGLWLFARGLCGLWGGWNYWWHRRLRSLRSRLLRLFILGARSFLLACRYWLRGLGGREVKAGLCLIIAGLLLLG